MNDNATDKSKNQQIAGKVLLVAAVAMFAVSFYLWREGNYLAPILGLVALSDLALAGFFLFKGRPG